MNNRTTVDFSAKSMKDAIEKMQQALTAVVFLQTVGVVHPEVYKLVEAGYSVDDAMCRFYLGVELDEKFECEQRDPRRSAIAHSKEAGECGSNG